MKQLIGLTPGMIWLLPVLAMRMLWLDQAVVTSATEGRAVSQSEQSVMQVAVLPPVIDPAGPFCTNDLNVILTATPPGGTWSGTGIVNASTGEFSPQTAGAGSHLITYTDPSAQSTSISIVVNSPPVISFISGDGTDCFGGSTGNTIISVTGGTPIPGPFGCQYIFDWDWDGTPQNDSYPTSCSGGIDLEDLNNLPAGIYFVTVTDLNGCTATGMAEVDEPAEITLMADDVMLPCFESTGIFIDLDVSGGNGAYVYDWDWDGTGINDDLGGPPSNTNDAQDPEIIGVGIYSVTVTDFLGCSSVISVSVTQPDELEASATSDPVLCTGGSSGEIDLTVSGGTPSFLFDWDYDGTGDNDDPEDPTGLPAGTYFVTVTDANGCTATAQVVVQEPLQAVTASATGTDVTCNGADNGSIDLTPGGGTGQYTFDWDNDGTGDNDDPEDLNNLPPGTYVVIVTDANGCTATASVTINEPPEITGTHNETICAGGSVVINGTVYDENNASGTEVFPAANGCDSTVTVTISFDPPLTGEETYEGCEGDGYEIVINGTAYNESNPSGTETLSNPDGCDSIVTITLTFAPPVTGEETYTGCEGDGYEVVVNGTTYNEGNPSGMETLLAANGCDSIVTIALTFNGNTTSTITNSGCTGDGFSVVVNGTTYNENNPSGVEVFPNQAGCDSTVTINLSFGQTSMSTVTNTSCSGSGYAVVVNGTTYNESNPSGTEVLVNSVGCDSTVTISLTFIAPTTGEETYSGCQGDGYEVIVGGTAYNESNPFGTETLTGSNGCDSIVTISLTFAPPATGQEVYSGCEGDGYSVIVNGTLYHEGNPTGTETLTGGNGCDSVVTINLTFNSNSMFTLSHQGCEGDGYQVIVGGVLFNENNPSGTVTIPNAAGCDSVVTVNLVFLQGTEGFVTYVGCEGDGYQIIVNGTTYNENNPSGFEHLINSAGCDSLVTIDLTFNEIPETFLEHQGCIGDGYFVIVNGTVYDETNPTGTETISVPGSCDSIVHINLEFDDLIMTLFNPTLCDGDFVIINGTIYDQQNPTGTETFQAIGGCDSIVEIDLSFLPPLSGTFEYIGCSGDGFSIVINGTVYNESNQFGEEIVESAMGCDSTVIINLDFLPALTGEFQPVLCAGGSIIYNGTLYDEDNPTGEETFPSPSGCDSIVTVTLTFLPILTGEENYVGCTGDGYEVVVNGVVYNEQNPTGVEYLETPEGCDSLVTISLVFQTSGSSQVNYEGCHDDGYSVVVNGNTYDEDNPTGEEHIIASGCDSVVYIDLIFHPSDTVQFNHQSCQGHGYSIVINGTTYDESNPTGIEVLNNQFGCDSVVEVSLQFVSTIETYMNPVLCAGGSMTIAGTVYDSNNPIDTVYLPAQGGCDSILYIALQFDTIPIGTVTYAGCLGDGYEVIVNGTAYNESNPIGVEEFQTAAGCDTIVNINMSFTPCCIPDTAYLQEMICAGHLYVFHGMDLDSAGHYTYISPNAVGPGCDSVYLLDLAVADVVTENLSVDICTGESYPFDGMNLTSSGIYHDTIIGGASQGCDSVVTLQLTVHALPPADAGPDQVITCATPSVALGAGNQSGSLSWTGPGITPGNINSQNPQVSKPGLYVLTVNGPGGCQSADTVVVAVDASTPIADAGPDLMISCKNPSVFLHAQVSGQNLDLLWEGPGIVPGNEHLPDHEITTTGMYILHLTDTVSMCAAIPDTVIVTDVTNTIVALVEAPDEMNCTFQVVELDGSGSSAGPDIVYAWMDPSGQYISDVPVIQVTNAGQYLFMVVDTFTGCGDSILVTVLNSESYPSIIPGSDLVLDCSMPSGNVSASIQGPSGDLVYQWTGPAGGIISDPTQLEIEVNAGGWYVISAMDTLNGCQSKDSVHVDNLIQVVDADLVIDNHITCFEAQAHLHAETSGQPGLLSVWMDASGAVIDTALMLTTTDPGQYYLLVIDPVSGCAGRDSAIVSQADVPVGLLELTDEGCRGDLQGSIFVAGVSGGQPPYRYLLDGGPGQDQPLFSGVAPGNHQVQVVDANGCIWQDEAFIAEGLDLQISLEVALELQVGETALLDPQINVPASQLDSIVWTPADQLSCDHCLQPTLTALHPGQISATVYAEGCQDMAIMAIRVVADHDVFIPNVFSPNSDHNNDFFFIYGSESVEIVATLQIFDRWGEKVFSNRDFLPNAPEEGWDGSFLGEALNPGVYVYFAEVHFRDGNTRIFSGDVTLVR